MIEKAFITYGESCAKSNKSYHTSKPISGHHYSRGWMMGGGARDSIPLFDGPSITNSPSHLPFVLHLTSFGSLSFPSLYNPLSLSAPHSPMNYGIANNAEIFGNSVVTFCTRLSIIKAFSII